MDSHGGPQEPMRLHRPRLCNVTSNPYDHTTSVEVQDQPDVVRIVMAGRDPIGVSISNRRDNILPLPLREGVGEGEIFCHAAPYPDAYGSSPAMTIRRYQRISQ